MSGDDRLATLFDTHADRLYRLARRLVSNADDAWDLVQETFLRAARSPSSVPRGLSEEEAWLVRVLINIRRDQWRRDAVRKRHRTDVSHSKAERQDPERALVIQTTVWSALEHLPPRRRAIVVLREIEGLETASIARLLDISAITVRWHLARGRRELAQRLRPQSGETNEQPQAALAGRGSIRT